MEIDKLSKTKRFDILDSLHETTFGYIEALHGILVNADPVADKRHHRLEGEIVKGIRESRRLSAEMTKNQSAVTLDDVLKFYGTLETVKLAMQIVMEAVSSQYYFELLKATRSITFMDQAKIWRRLVREMRIKYRDVEKSEDAVVFASVIGIVDVGKNYRAILDTIRRHPAPNRLAIKLMSIMANNTDVRLGPIIERYKDVVLQSPVMVHPDTSRHVESPLVWIVGCVHVIPATPYMEPAALFREYFDYAYDLSATLTENVTRATGKSSIVIMKNVTREIDYNILPILSAEYYTRHKLFTNSENGINKLIWKRFDTVRDVQTGPPDDNFVVNAIHGIGECVVVENTGMQCRLLSYKFGNTSVDIATMNRIITGVSQRPTAYGAIAEYYILERCGDPRGRDLPRLYEARIVKPTPTDSLKRNILEDLKTQYEPDVTLVGNEAMERFVAVCRDANIYRPTLTRHVAKYLELREIKTRELRATFVVKMDTIIREFRRRLEDAIKQHINVGIFSARTDYRAYLMGAYSDVMNTVIETLDSAPSTWQSVDVTLKEYFIMQRGGD